MISGIYKIEHVPTGRVYVGSALHLSARRSFHRHHLRNGTHHSSKLQRAWTKYGEQAFSFRTLLLCAPRDLIFYEQRAMDAFDAVRQGFNCVPKAGNSLGYKHTPEALAKMSRASMGRRNQYSRGAVMSQATKDKIGAANTGRTRTPEALAKLRAKRVGRRPALGMRHSLATRAKMSIARQGHGPSAEHMERLRLLAIGRRHTPETRAKISLARRGKKQLTRSKE